MKTHLKALVHSFVVVVFLLASAGHALAADPVATSFSATVSTVGATLLQLQGSDADGTPLTFAIASGPSHGTLSGLNTSTGYVVYTPASGYVGSDSFTYTVTSGGDTTAAATVSITVTNAKTRIMDTLVDPAGNPRSGKVTFILTQKAFSPGGLIVAGSTASAVLSGAGQFDISVYPSTALSPQSYYQVWFEATGSIRREIVGVYSIPASATTITNLEAHRVINTSLAAQYTFVDQAALNTILSVASGVAAIYTGTPTDNTLQKYDSATGKLENSSLGDNGSTVTIANKVQMTGTKSIEWEATGINPPSTSDIYQGSKLLPYPGAAPDHLAIGVEAGFFWFTSGGGYKFYFDAANPDYWEAAGLTIGGHVTATNFLGDGSALTGLTFSQLGGAATDSQIPDDITVTDLDASAVISGIFNPARLGSGTADSTTILRGNNTWVAPSVLGLVTATSGTADAYARFNGATGITPGYLKQETNMLSMDGAGAGPQFNLYTNGSAGAANYTRGVLRADANVTELTAEAGGTFSSQVGAVRLKSLGTGSVTQIGRSISGTDTIHWTFDGNTFFPNVALNGQIGKHTNPIVGLNLGPDSPITWNNSGVAQVFLSGNAGALTLWSGGLDGSARLRFGGGPSIFNGSGSPEGVETAEVGSIYSDTSTGHIWRKETGSGDTGWVDMSSGGGGGGGGGGESLLSTTTLDLTLTTAQDLYTVTTGKTLVVTRVVIRSQSPSNLEDAGNLTFKESGSDLPLLGTFDLSVLTNSSRFFTHTASSTSVQFLVASGNKVQAVHSVDYGASASVVVDLFGYEF